ncbi:MAG: tetratricopeptide repeat protein [Pseudomonadota bacterium]
MHDQYGVETSASSSTEIDGYARALRAFHCYRGDPTEIIAPTLEQSPDFAMGLILHGHVNVSMWERSVVEEVGATVAKLDALEGKMNEREKMHTHALRQWTRGDWDGARTTLELLIAKYPRDILALQMGHLCDFYHGDRENLRGRVARVLAHWTNEDEAYPFLLGMLAFGLEECADYGKAEEAARHALDLVAEDCWAHHAITHVFEMQARQDEGIAFMESREPHWAQPDSGFRFHNWWHLGLFHLDNDRFDQVLDIYDRGVREDAESVQLMMVDATAMLWRLHLRDVDVGERWDELVDKFAAAEHEAGFYAFNDMHAAFAFAASGRHDDLKNRLAAAKLAMANGTTNAMMTKVVGLPVLEGIVAFAERRYSDAVAELLPVRYRANAFGGSHAQRDIIHRTLIEAAMRAQDVSLAKSLIEERQQLRPSCPFSWRLSASVSH